MLRVLRQPTGLDAGAAARDGTTPRRRPGPGALRLATPAAAHHEWVRARFVDPDQPRRRRRLPALPARRQPAPRPDAYTANARSTSRPAERERLLNGDWEIPDDGELFQRDWFPIDRARPAARTSTVAVRYWDLAATEPSPANPDPDWTVGLRLDLDPNSGIFYITDIVRVRKAPGAVEQLVARPPQRDGRDGHDRDRARARRRRQGRHRPLQPPRSSRGYTVRSDRPTGPKDDPRPPRRRRRRKRPRPARPQPHTPRRSSTN